MIEYRELQRTELHNIWSIDRGEKIEAEYFFQNERLRLRRVEIEVAGWPEDEKEKNERLFEMYHKNGGWFYGAFERQVLVGVVVLSSEPIAISTALVELKFLYVDRDYRKQLLGQSLFKLAAEEADKRGSKGLYVSATPTKRTIDFYIRMGCTLARKSDPKLYDLEPEDVHLEYHIDQA